jgi:hypothetical protein
MGGDGDKYGWWQHSDCPLHGAVSMAGSAQEATTWG